MVQIYKPAKLGEIFTKLRGGGYFTYQNYHYSASTEGLMVEKKIQVESRWRIRFRYANWDQLKWLEIEKMNENAFWMCNGVVIFCQEKNAIYEKNDEKMVCEKDGYFGRNQNALPSCNTKHNITGIRSTPEPLISPTNLQFWCLTITCDIQLSEFVRVVNPT